MSIFRHLGWGFALAITVTLASCEQAGTPATTSAPEPEIKLDPIASGPVPAPPLDSQRPASVEVKPAPVEEAVAPSTLPKGEILTNPKLDLDGEGKLSGWSVGTVIAISQHERDDNLIELALQGDKEAVVTQELPQTVLAALTAGVTLDLTARAECAQSEQAHLELVLVYEEDGKKRYVPVRAMVTDNLQQDISARRKLKQEDLEGLKTIVVGWRLLKGLEAPLIIESASFTIQ